MRAVVPMAVVAVAAVVVQVLSFNLVMKPVGYRIYIPLRVQWLEQTHS